MSGGNIGHFIRMQAWTSSALQMPWCAPIKDAAAQSNAADGGESNGIIRSSSRRGGTTLHICTQIREGYARAEDKERLEKMMAAGLGFHDELEARMHHWTARGAATAWTRK